MDTPDGTTLATCPYFQVDQIEVAAGDTLGNPNAERFSIVSVVSGELQSMEGTTYKPGDFLLLPRGAFPLTATTESSVLQTTIPG